MQGKIVLIEKFIAINVYFKKQEISKIYNLNLCLMELEKANRVPSGQRERNNNY